MKKKPVKRLSADVTFPAPGPQDCYKDHDTFTVVGSKPAETVIDRVRVFVNDSEFNSDGPETDAADPTKWTAAFSTLTKATGNLIPNNPCRLLVETSDQANTGFRFTHVPLPAGIKLTSVQPGAGHALTITGTTKNTDIATLSISAAGGSVTNIVRNADGSFSCEVDAFTSLPDVFFTVESTGDEESVSFDFQLEVDFDDPIFSDLIVDDSGNPVTIAGSVVDDQSGFTDTNALQVSVIGVLTGPVDPGIITMNPLTLSADHKTITFTINVDSTDLAPDQYIVDLIATDVAGNQGETSTSFNA